MSIKWCNHTHTHTQKEQIVFLSSIYKLAGVFLWFPILHCTTKPIWFSPKRWGPAGGQWDCLKWPKIIPKKIKGSRINPPRSSLSPTETRFPRFCFSWARLATTFFFVQINSWRKRKKAATRKASSGRFSVHQFSDSSEKPFQPGNLGPAMQLKNLQKFCRKEGVMDHGWYVFWRLPSLSNASFF